MAQECAYGRIEILFPHKFKAYPLREKYIKINK